MSHRLAHRALAVVLGILLVGCASVTSYKPMPKPAADAAKTADVVVQVPDKNLRVVSQAVNVTVMPGGAVGVGAAAAGGLIGSLIVTGINASIASGIETDMAALASHLEAVDYGRAMLVALDEAGTGKRTLPARPARKAERPLALGDLPAYARSAGTDVVVFLNLTHFFLLNSTTPTIAGSVRVVGRDGNELARDEVLIAVPSAPGKDHVVNAAWWKDGDRYRNVLAHAARAFALAADREFLSRAVFLTEAESKAALDGILEDAPKQGLQPAPACMADATTPVRYAFTRTRQALLVDTECVSDATRAGATSDSKYVWRSATFPALTPALLTAMATRPAATDAALKNTGPAITTATAAATTATGAMAFMKGDRLRYASFDFFSGAQVGERVMTVTTATDDLLDIDDGRLRFDRQGRLVAGSSPAEAMFSGAVPPKLEIGTTWQADFVPTGNDGPQVASVKTDMALVGLEERTLGQARIPVARVRVSGYSPAEWNTGGGGRPSPITGDILVDVRTGLVVEGRVRSASRKFSMNRKLVEVVR